MYKIMLHSSGLIAVFYLHIFSTAALRALRIPLPLLYALMQTRGSHRSGVGAPDPFVFSRSSSAPTAWCWELPMLRGMEKEEGKNKKIKSNLSVCLILAYRELQKPKRLKAEAKGCPQVAQAESERLGSPLRAAEGKRGAESGRCRDA